MRVVFIIALGLLVASTYKYGAPGFVAGLMLALFVLLGLGGIIMGKGVTYGIGGVFAWFILFIAVMLGMFLFERFGQDNASPGTYGDPAYPQKVYFADKVFAIYEGWLGGDPPLLKQMADSPSTIHFNVWSPVPILCFIGMGLGLVALITKPKG